MIVIVDYRKGNLLSVARGLEAAGAQVLVSQDADVIARADAVVLPGVGAFADAMETIVELGQDEAMREAVGARAVPFLGICLGMHLMFEAGEEHAGGDAPTPGLGLLPGIVRQLPRVDEHGASYKIPHVGWNAVNAVPGAPACPLFAGIPDGSHFYFTHSYAAPDSPATVAVTSHSVTFPCAVQAGRAFGVQFHPEKSSDVGHALLAGFVDLVRKG